MQDFKIAPRFPGQDGKGRKAEDKSELCGRWKENGGCELDRDFVISELDPFNGKMTSRNFFDFMQTACLASCGWAQRKESLSIDKVEVRLGLTGTQS